MKKIVVFLMMVALGLSSRGVAAQDLFESQTLGELPPQMMLPEPTDMFGSSSDPLMLPSEQVQSKPVVRESLSLPTSSGDLTSQALEPSMGRELQFFDCQPAMLESSGTWLRRGFWSAEIDGMIMNRMFDRNSVPLVQSAVTLDSLQIEGNKPGAEGFPRLKVGRFLFRDEENRDHTAEFVISGGGNWSQSGRFDGGNLQVPFILGRNNPAFDGAQSTQFEYDAWFNNFELNYHVKQRMLRDRMELEPSGHWVRRAQPSNSLSMLAGLRFFDMGEKFIWTAFGIPDADNDGVRETGLYDIRVQNQLIGTQLGGSYVYETARWSVGAYIKGGMYLNMSELESQFDVSGGITSGQTDLQEDYISWIGEAALIGKYHLRPNFSIRAGLEVMHLSHMAVAPSQIDFRPSGSESITNGNDIYFLGGSLGLESYW